MATVIREYQYLYGAGSHWNRCLEFMRTEDDDPKTIFVVVKARKHSGWGEISELRRDQVEVEMMTTTDKVRTLKEEKATGRSLPLSKKTLLSELDNAKQREVLQGIEPIGTWRVTITNDFGSDPIYERVAHLCLFNPI
ncbi:MAG: hypothetical protein KR126chlam5_01169 [Candidatus Anoxychlamydiales bacterium]|nr:hypothetical protein [Candidatus Anoxychlamydiales bacterium]